MKRKGFDDGICPIHSGAAKPFEAIFVSTKKNDAPDPLIVILHGGPHSVSLSSFSKSLAFLSSIGYSLLIVNYRWVKINLCFFRKSLIWDRNPNLLLCLSIWLKLTLVSFSFHFIFTMLLKFSFYKMLCYHICFTKYFIKVRVLCCFLLFQHIILLLTLKYICSSSVISAFTCLRNFPLKISFYYFIYIKLLAWHLSLSNMLIYFRGSLGFGEEALQSLPGKVGSQVLILDQFYYICLSH